MAVIFHPETGGFVEVPSESVWHYRQSGWVLREEWEDSQRQLAAQQAALAVAQAADEKPATASRTSKPADKESK